MITIQLSFVTGQHPREVASATVGGVDYSEASRSSCIAKLARALVAAGIPDQPWIAVAPTGTVALRGRSLHGIAKTTITESDRGGLARRIWHPHPGGSVASGSEAPGRVGGAG
jgi:hypothetical protein